MTRTFIRGTRFTQKGIGLLELLLSLAIIAVILIMATRYFASTRQAQKVSDTVQLAQTILSAATTLGSADTQNVSANITTTSVAVYVPKEYLITASGVVKYIATPFNTIPNDDKGTAPNSFITVAAAATANTTYINQYFQVELDITTADMGQCQAIQSALSGLTLIPGTNTPIAAVVPCAGSGTTFLYKGYFPVAY